MLPDHNPDMESIPFDKYLNDEAMECIGNINRKLRSVMKRHDFKPISLEEPVWSDELRVAGRVDYFGYLDGKLAIVDLKTSKSFYDETKSEYATRVEYMDANNGKAPPAYFTKHALQLSMYKQAFRERRGVEAEELWILRVNENNKPELRLMPDVLDDVKEVRQMYYEQYGM